MSERVAKGFFIAGMIAMTIGLIILIVGQPSILFHEEQELPIDKIPQLVNRDVRNLGFAVMGGGFIITLIPRFLGYRPVRRTRH